MSLSRLLRRREMATATTKAEQVADPADKILSQIYDRSTYDSNRVQIIEPARINE